MESLKFFMSYIFDNDEFSDKNYLNNFFDVIYVICLDSRREHMNKFIKKLNLNVQFIDPVLKKNLSYSELFNKGIITQFVKNKMTLGECACYLSHLKTHKIFQKSNYNKCLILEDDLEIPYIFNNKTNEKYKKILNKVPKNWEALYLGRCWDVCRKTQKINNDIIIPFRPLCTHAIGFTKIGSIKFLKNKFPIKQPVDHFFSDNILMENIYTYAITPNLFNQDRESNNSSIVENRGNNLKECI